jgi:hypothetical protein
MPVAIFENQSDRILTFTLEPDDEQFELPLLAKIGIRYAFDDGSIDRTFAAYGEHGIRFWCDAANREVEIVHPGPFDRLLWDMCIKLGFCGGIVNDRVTHVTDLLPATGTVTARDFAELAISAECDVKSPPAKHDRWVAQLEAMFVEYMGEESVPAQALVTNLAIPFEDQAASIG